MMWGAYSEEGIVMWHGTTLRYSHPSSSIFTTTTILTQYL